MLALDVVLLMMITICIVYCWVLNQRIRDLHHSRVEFARMIREFDNAVIKAQNCISELSTLGSNATFQIKNASIEGQDLVHEIKTITELGNNLCTKLEKSISSARQIMNDLEDSMDAVEPVKMINKSTKAKTVKTTKAIKNKSHNIDDLLPEQQNLLETALSKITTHKHKGKVDQTGFYDSLRKVSSGK